MKKLAFFSLLVFVVVFAASCRKKTCEILDCGPQGNCELGYCECNPGFGFDDEGRCSDTLYCYNRDCGNGDCIELQDSCACDIQYEHDANGKCTRLYRDHFIGDWSGTHITATGTTVGPYTMNISAGAAGINQIKIINFGNITCPTTGTGLEVLGNVTSPTVVGLFQPVCTGTSGVGGTFLRIDPTRIDVAVTVFQTNGSIRCDGIFTKQ